MGVRTRRNNRKKYRYRANSNRKEKKMDRKINPHIECVQVRKAWDKKKPAPANLADMGLVYHLERDVPVESKTQNEETSEMPPRKRIKRGKEEKPTEVVKQLEEAINEEYRRKESAGIRLTNAQVEYATAMLDKYGDNYKAMARDRKNYFQDTWKQIRAKINLFTQNPKYYAPYLKQKGLFKPELLKSQEK
ncbi:nucleolar protein 16-like [Homarus americanus]|uniref:Nucleolar protein 16 n=1 Tax=Homarus americanus TaxID=6706 RepID=A0A8J5N7P3_HOMAM|nr:nucleolar protein 16-like [Homarus americanus]XP_042212548.1 nucleolar protein 16-like [Homarus americanus]KAG7174113.1 Nucleolar protein 16-like [Homarus americanus]